MMLLNTEPWSALARGRTPAHRLGCLPRVPLGAVRVEGVGTLLCPEPWRSWCHRPPRYPGLGLTGPGRSGPGRQEGRTRVPHALQAPYRRTRRHGIGEQDVAARACSRHRRTSSARLSSWSRRRTAEALGRMARARAVDLDLREGMVRGRVLACLAAWSRMVPGTSSHRHTCGSWRTRSVQHRHGVGPRRLRSVR